MMDLANGRSVDDEGVVAEEEEGPASLVRSTGVARAREDDDDEREERRGEGAGAITGVGGSWAAQYRAVTMASIYRGRRRMTITNIIPERHLNSLSRASTRVAEGRGRSIERSHVQFLVQYCFHLHKELV